MGQLTRITRGDFHHVGASVTAERIQNYLAKGWVAEATYYHPLAFS